MPNTSPGKRAEAEESKRRKRSKHEVNLEGTDFGALLNNRSLARATNKLPRRVALLKEIQDMHECFVTTEQDRLTPDQIESILFKVETIPEKIQVVFLSLPKIKDETTPRNPRFWEQSRINSKTAQLASKTLCAWAFEEEAVEIANLCATKDEEAKQQLQAARQEMKKQTRFQEAEVILDALENAFSVAEPSIEAFERGKEKIDMAIETEQRLREYNETLFEQLGCNDPRSTTPAEGVELIREGIQVIVALLHDSVEFSRQKMEQAEVSNESVSRSAEIADGLRKSYVRPVSREEGQRRAMKRNLNSQEKYLERMKKAQESKAEQERINMQNQNKWLGSNTIADSKDEKEVPEDVA